MEMENGNGNGNGKWKPNHMKNTMDAKQREVETKIMRE